MIWSDLINEKGQVLLVNDAHGTFKEEVRWIEEYRNFFTKRTLDLSIPQ